MIKILFPFVVFVLTSDSWQIYVSIEATISQRQIINKVIDIELEFYI